MYKYKLMNTYTYINIFRYGIYKRKKKKLRIHNSHKHTESTRTSALKYTYTFTYLNRVSQNVKKICQNLKMELTRLKPVYSNAHCDALCFSRGLLTKNYSVRILFHLDVSEATSNFC